VSITSTSLLATTLEEWITEQVADSFFDSTETCQMILKSKAGLSVDGGDALSWTVTTNRVADPAFVPDGGTFGIDDNQEFLSKAQLNWAQLGRAIRRDRGDFDVYNKGRGRVINLATQTLDNLKESFRQFAGQNLWASPLPANGWIPLSWAVLPHTGLVAPYNYAGIASSTDWCSVGLRVPAANPTIAQVASVIDELRFRNRAKPTMAVTSFALYQALRAEAITNIQYTNVRTDVVTELNISTFTISGVPFYVDPFLNDQAADGAFTDVDPRGVAGANRIYILDTNNLALVPQPAGTLAGEWKTIDGLIRVSPWTDLSVSPDVLDKYQIVASAHVGLVSLNRRCHAVIWRT